MFKQVYQKRIKQIVELRHILKRQKGEFAGAMTLVENDKNNQGMVV